MFKVGEFVSYGCIGVCKVEGITKMDMDRTHNSKDYYILRPVFEEKRTIYCPVENRKVNIRKNITEEESYRLLDQIPSLQVFSYDNRKNYEMKCKEAVMSGDCEEWMRLIKTLIYERRIRVQQGRKITSSNEKYLHEAENKLYGELSVALKKEKSQIESMMSEILMKMD